MSTYWMLHCATCGESADMDSINRGDDAILAMIAVARHLLAYPGATDLDLTLQVEMRWVPLYFMHEHNAHRLVARSEYGEERDGT